MWICAYTPHILYTYHRTYNLRLLNKESTEFRQDRAELVCSAQNPGMLCSQGRARS